MKEDDLLTTVLDLAKSLGVLTAHFRPAQTQTGRWITPVQGDGKGFPDLVLVGRGGVLYRELKSAKGSVSPEQRVWLERLAAAGADVGVWRPADLLSGRIAAELQGARRSAVAS